MPALDAYLTERLRETSFGTSVVQFVFCFEIADFEPWGAFFKASASYTSYQAERGVERRAIALDRCEGSAGSTVGDDHRIETCGQGVFTPRWSLKVGQIPDPPTVPTPRLSLGTTRHQERAS